MESISEASGERFVLALAERKLWQVRLLSDLSKHAGYRRSRDGLIACWQAARGEGAANHDETSAGSVVNAQWLLRSREEPALLPIDTLSPDELAWRARSSEDVQLASYIAALDSHLQTFGLMFQRQPAQWAREAVHAAVSKTFIAPSSVFGTTRLAERVIVLQTSLAGALVDVAKDLDPRSHRAWRSNGQMLPFSSWEELEEAAVAAVRAAVAEMRRAVQYPMSPPHERVVRRYAGRDDGRRLACERLAGVLAGVDRVSTDTRRKQLSRFASLVEIDPPPNRSTPGQI